MKTPELLLPGGNKDCVRAAVANGADAIYLGMQTFNARMNADNITDEELPAVIRFCHKKNVRVYVALNTLVKNEELGPFLDAASWAKTAQADALIIQDIGLIPHIRKSAPGLAIHLSTQAGTSNTLAIPKGVSRIILPRESSLADMNRFSKAIETEVFIHGALCFSYSGQCLFSSIVGGRSGNRGTCAQPCRKRYNGSFLLSTKDLCLLPRLPEIIKTGVCSLKVEGRMRSPLYVGTVARIYRKAIDSHSRGHFSFSEEDIDLLKLAFNREFTEGFAFEKKVTDSRAPMNRGLYLGKTREGKLIPQRSLGKGDGLAIWSEKGRVGHVLGKAIEKGETLHLGAEGEVYLTSSKAFHVDLGEEIPITKEKRPVNRSRYTFPQRDGSEGAIRIIVNARSKSQALEADRAGADIIYYDIMDKDFSAVRKLIRKAKLFARTPRIIDDEGLEKIKMMIRQLDPQGILAGERGVLGLIGERETHLDYSFNIFNDADISYYGYLPIISPELSLEEITGFRSRKMIVLIHGDLILMTTKEPLRCPELIDEEGRHFRVREENGMKAILNCREIGLFGKAYSLKEAGIRDFLIDTKGPGKYVRIYRKILSGIPFDDRKIRKGYTTGNFLRPVA